MLSEFVVVSPIWGVYCCLGCLVWREMPAESAPPAIPARAEWSALRGWYLRLSVAAALSAVALIGPRIYILWPATHEAASTVPLKAVLKAAVSGGYDAVVIGVALAVFFVLLAAVRKKLWACRISYCLFLLTASLLLLAGILHARLMNVLHHPFNYRWLQYSDFLHSIDSHEAIKASLSWQMGILLLTAVAAYLLISIHLGNRLARSGSALRFSERRIGAVVLSVFLVWAAIGHGYAKLRGWPYERLANPVYAFAQSWALASRQPSLFTMHTPFGDSEFEPPARSAVSDAVSAKSDIKNVIVFVLESTPAEYLGAYHSQYRVTPNLDRWSAKAALFENVYAHAPATNKSLFSLLCSLYPWISYKSETEDLNLPVPSLAACLRQRGYATGFFSSGDLSFQGAAGFLQSHGFEFLQDYKQRRITRTIFRDKRWPFLNGSDDISTAESMTSWFDQHHRAGRPVFAMLWTNMTHYPYFTERAISDLGPKENRFNLYLNALHYSDEAFGTVMQWLEKRNLVNQTLVVVAGDHGEAFGRHNQLTHAGNIYEENCHVPLLLINPGLFTGQRQATIAGMIDIAPTIVQILGYAPAKDWQGQSLFSKSRRARTYFFSPWSDYLFGLREGTTKFIYNASKNSYEVYDLSTDPLESKNLMTTRDRQLKPDLLRLAAWVQYEDRLFKRLSASGSHK